MLYQGELRKYSSGRSLITSFTTSQAYTFPLYRLTTVVICSFNRCNNTSLETFLPVLSIKIQRGAWLCQHSVCPRRRKLLRCAKAAMLSASFQLYSFSAG